MLGLYRTASRTSKQITVFLQIKAAFSPRARAFKNP